MERTFAMRKMVFGMKNRAMEIVNNKILYLTFDD